MSTYLVFDVATGRIKYQICTAQEADIQPALIEGESYISGEGNDELFYVDGINIIERPLPVFVQNTDSINANGVDLITVSGIPEGADFFLNGPVKQHQKTDGTTVEITTDIAGEYRLEVIAFPYQAWRGVFHAN